MNSAFVGYEELGRFRRVLSTEAEKKPFSICLILHILLSLIHALIAKYCISIVLPPLNAYIKY